jgi:threonine dehydratase
MTTDASAPTYADIEAAAKRIAPWAVITPLLEHPELNERSGGRVFLKLETLQRTGSFKFRGACNRISLIPEGERPRGVVAFSSGNHAQGVAAAAALFGLPATIVMPTDAPRAKVEGTRRYGASVVHYNRLTDDREAIAAKLQAETGATLIKPFDDPQIVAGQGTCGLELAKQAAACGVKLDAVLAPCSGGGLVSGISLALATTSPDTLIFAVEPQGYDGMGLSLAAGARTAATANTGSIADALMAPIPGVFPFAVARQHVAGGLTVSDDDMVRAVSFAVLRLKLVVEPGGAAALAAVLSGRLDTRDRHIAVVLSGANCDPETLAACCAKAPPVP